MIPVLRNLSEIEAFIQQKAPASLAASSDIESRVGQIVEEVRQGGDQALKKIIARLNDPVLPDSRFQLLPSEVIEACERVSDKHKAVMAYAASNIEAFAKAVVKSVQPVCLQHEAFSVGLDWSPVARVACYVPAGHYPLPSTALMTAITAKVAGVKDIVIVSPRLTDDVIYAGQLAGATSFYQLGGAQAIAAMAYGSESIQPASMVVGPGNAYVTEAKRQLQGIIGIDMLAGPSEVVIIADAEANPEWVAWDLLAQAEHSPDACAYLLTDSERLLNTVLESLKAIVQNEGLPVYLSQSDSWGCIALLPDISECIRVCNQLAPEHVELQVRDPEAIKGLLTDYGALFMGDGTPVPFGDYAAGPNHTLPTNRSARFSGTLTPLVFLRPQSWINASLNAGKLSSSSRDFAAIEGLLAHKKASSLRLPL